MVYSNFKQILFILFFSFAFSNIDTQNQKSKQKEKIQIAFLMDVSGSMSSLMSQLKSQYWNLINFINTAQKGKLKPEIEFALITFGNEGSKINGFVELISPLSNDMDKFFEGLYQPKIPGGEEYCGQALAVAFDSLRWSSNKKDLRLIFIAGNESFEQGSVPFRMIVDKCVKNDIRINAIFCGEEEEGIQLSWKEVADRGNGTFNSISKTDSLLAEKIILDEGLFEFNKKINSTFLPFGHQGKEMFDKLIMNDNQAEMLGIIHFRERMELKSSPYFKNESWDLIDAFKKDNLVFQKIKTENLPVILQNKSKDEIQKFILEMSYKRTLYQDAIKSRLEKINQYVNPHKNKKNELITLIKKNLINQAKKKGFTFTSIETD